MTAASSDPVERQPRLLRPYVLTQGRTRSGAVDLPLDAPVLAVAGTDPEQAETPEARAIVALTRLAMSIAELAGRLHVPLGVSRVLVADLAVAGLVTVHLPRAADSHTDVTLLEKLLVGIRAL
jgi:hypothetical protein